MKKILLPVVSLALLCGCSSFGSFQSVEKGKTTTDQVRSMLGDPASIKFQVGGEVWEYQFVQNQMDRTRQQTVMNMEIAFKDNAVSDYSVTASRRAAPPMEQQRPDAPTQQRIEQQPMPPQQEQPRQQPQQQQREQPRMEQQRQPASETKAQESKFIQEFDKNGDGRVARDEFNGPARLFEQFDRNQDGFVDKAEAPVGPPPQGQGHQGVQPRR